MCSSTWASAFVDTVLHAWAPWSVASLPEPATTRDPVCMISAFPTFDR